MTLAALISELEAHGVTAVADRAHVRFRGSPAALSDELRAALRREAAGIRIHLTRRLVSCRNLYRYVHSGDVVTTPDGNGKVLQVFADRVTVNVGGQALFFSPEDLTIAA